MVANADVTLYRKRYDPDVRDDTWTHTHYTGVHWYGGTGVKLLNNRTQTGDHYTVRIFTPKALDVREGDIVVRGLHEADTPSDIAAESIEQFSVTSVLDNRRGSPCMHHWKLGGG